MNRKLQIALAAAFGGMSPLLLEAAVGLRNGSFKSTDPWGFTGAALLFGLMGGLTALAWKETQSRRAYCLGLGLPGLILSIAAPTASQPAGSPPQVPAPSIGSLSLFATPAYAAQPVGDLDLSDDGRHILIQGAALESAQKLSYESGRRVTLYLDDVPAGTEVIIASEDLQTNQREVLEASDKGKRRDIIVPDFGAVLFLRNGLAESRPVRLETGAGSVSAFNVDVDKPFLPSFLYSLGFRNTSIYEFEVEAARLAPVP